MKTIQVQKQGDYYTCEIGITKEEWLAILQDKDTNDSYREALLCFYYMPGHRGSCTVVGRKMGKKASALNILVSKFGNHVKKKYKDRFEVVNTNGKPALWIIPMNNGKILNSRDNGSFEWELREELAEAIDEYLYWYLLEQYKKLRKEIPIHQKGFGKEIYKWQLITASEGKSVIQIVSDHILHPGTASLGGFVNLIDATRDNKSLKYLINDKPEEYKKILEQLIDENIPLNERFTNFKTSTASLFSTRGYNSQANDERTAAAILTCVNPDKYTFYKHNNFYDRFCKYLGVSMENAGLCYSHYLSLIQPLANMVEADVELHEIVSPSLANMKKSNLLLAQDILWTLMVSFTKQLGYIYYLLFNTDKKMEDKNINEFLALLEANHNLILTGAPGTGKTHSAKEIAAKMINVDANDIESNDQFGFVQFHPSYDYTDFVEGLRPTTDGNGGFELRYGVFKDFCAKAISKYETKDFDAVFDELITSIGDTILKLKTPQGADYGVSVNSRGNLRLHTGADLNAQGVLTRENIKSLFAGMPIYQYWRGYYEGVLAYLKEEFHLIQKDNDPNKKYVFVIDEINRGEISKIMGELFFSIDPGYRGLKGIVQTQYQNMINEGDVFKNGFYVPENVYIIGTMNDIDRSVESMDFAMRRRFAWKEITAEDSMVMLDKLDDLIGAPIDEIKTRMTNLNAAIVGCYTDKDGNKRKIQGLNQSFQIGAAYFMNYAKYMDQDDAFNSLWEYHLKGLLMEYLRGNTNPEEDLKFLKESYDDNTNHKTGQPTSDQPEN